MQSWFVFPGLSFHTLWLILPSMMGPNGFSNWLEIDRQAIRNNIQSIQDLTRTPVMAVVKANGYGHGIIEVARIASEAGAAFCGIARIEEGLELRTAGIRMPLLVLGYTPPYRFDRAIEADISLTVFEPAQIDPLIEAARRVGKQATVHIKVETGMGRLGADPKTALAMLEQLHTCPEVEVEGLFTHYARADELNETATDSQERIFGQLVQSVMEKGLRPQIVHTANSAAALTRPDTHFDMVRMGIAMYGLAPSPVVPLPAGIQPGLTWKAQLCEVRTLPPGTGISYGHIYTTKEYERIGVVPVGYGDGYRRVPGNSVLVNGCKVPIVGRVCMDQMMVQLDSVPDAQIGDEVVLIGSQGEEKISADMLAERWQTINYEVVCGISARVPRIYFDSSEDQ